MFYQKEIIEKLINCPICTHKYVNPRLLPCGNSACQDCIIGLKGKDSDNEFKCSICEGVHTIPKEGFIVNKTIKELLNKKANDVIQSAKVEELKMKLDNIFKD